MLKASSIGLALAITWPLRGDESLSLYSVAAQVNGDVSLHLGSNPRKSLRLETGLAKSVETTRNPQTPFLWHSMILIHQSGCPL